MPMQKNSNRAKCYLSAVAFAFLCLACGGRTAKGGQIEGTLIDISAPIIVDTLNFGKVRAGEVVELPLTFVNPTEKPIVLLSTETSCGCLELTFDKEPLRQGEKMGAKMTFYSSGYNYFPPRAFYIKTSASLEPKKLVVMADMD